MYHLLQFTEGFKWARMIQYGVERAEVNKL